MIDFKIDLCDIKSDIEQTREALAAENRDDGVISPLEVRLRIQEAILKHIKVPETKIRN